MLHAVFRPYLDKAGNLVVVLFSICVVLGAFAETGDLTLQMLHVVVLLVSLAVLAFFALRHVIHLVMSQRRALQTESEAGQQQQQQQGPSGGGTNDDEGEHKMSSCEMALLVPFLLLVGAGPALVALVLWILRCMLVPCLCLTRKGKVAGWDESCLFEMIDSLQILLLTPIFVVLYLGTHGQYKHMLAGFGLLRVAQRSEAAVWYVMFERKARHREEQRRKEALRAKWAKKKTTQNTAVAAGVDEQEQENKVSNGGNSTDVSEQQQQQQQPDEGGVQGDVVAKERLSDMTNSKAGQGLRSPESSQPV